LLLPRQTSDLDPPTSLLSRWYYRPEPPHPVCPENFSKRYVAFILDQFIEILKGY
jgi:hypothetical protein